jgi:hypothetical protein
VFYLTFEIIFSENDKKKKSVVFFQYIFENKVREIMVMFKRELFERID